MREPVLVLMAKQPVPGQVKTRLECDSDRATAAAVAATLIRATVDLARTAWRGPLELHASPDADHPLLHALSRTHALVLRPQAPGNLGARMQAALAQGISSAGACAVMGCDVPHCPPAALERACELLSAGRTVLGPARDGGFWLLGVASLEPGLLDDDEWGTPSVRERLLARAARAGIFVDTSLPCLRDIDTWPDLVAAARDCPALQRFVMRS